MLIRNLVKYTLYRSAGMQFKAVFRTLSDDMNRVMCVGVVKEGFALDQNIRKEFTPLTVHYFFCVFEPIMIIYDTCMCQYDIMI